MSRENVEVVRGLLNDDVDLVQLDQPTSRAEVEAWMGPCVHPDFETIDRSGAVRRQRLIGLDEWRQGWRDWLEAWESYHVVSEELIDLGDKVVVLDRSYGRRRGLDAEVCRVGATVYTFRDEKIARIEYLVDRDQALEAVGRRE